MKDFRKHINPWLGEMLEQLQLDIEYTRAEGCFLYDKENREYLDFVSAYGALPFGHNPDEVWDALQGIREKGLPNFAQPSALAPAAALAKRLCELSGMDHVTFTNSGAEAVEAAIKLVRSATGRRKVLSTKNSFHGKTLGALSATGKASYQEAFFAPAEGFAYIPFGDASALENYFQEHARETAGFFLEPIQGEGGVVVPPQGYLAQVRDLCSQFNVPLVLDEIQTGLGRTGWLFAFQAEGIEPDVLLLAKALGGGLVPVGACLTKSELYSPDYGMKHSSTFAGNTMAAQVGMAVLDILTRDDQALIRQVREVGDYLSHKLQELTHKFDFVKVRGRGLMLGLEFKISRASHPHSLIGIMAEQQLLTPVISSHLLLKHGVRVAPTLNGADVVRIQAPLTVEKTHVHRLLAALEQVLPILDRGDTACLLSPILGGGKISATLRNRVPLARTAAHPGQRRFAFLVHPLDTKSFSEYDPSLKQLSQAQLQELVDTWQKEMNPFVISQAELTSATGETAWCEFINVPRIAQQLIEMDEDASLDIVRQGVRLAKERGAELVGLGAFTSVVSWGGMRLRNEEVPLTTGNSYTVISAGEAVVTALDRLQLNPAASTAAVVGAAGSIGRCLALLLSESVERIILLGNPANPQRSKQKLNLVAGETIRHLLTSFPKSPMAKAIAASGSWPSTDSPIETFAEIYAKRADRLPILVSCDADHMLPQADVVVTATSSVSELVNPSNVKFGAVVCDLSRPANVSREIQRLRPDVLVIDGGVIEVPGRPDLGWDFGFETGLAYACMAETMMLALEGHLEHTSIGSNLPLESITLVRELTVKHGFKVADLRSFDKPLSDKDWQRTLEARSAKDGSLRPVSAQ